MEKINTDYKQQTNRGLAGDKPWKKKGKSILRKIFQIRVRKVHRVVSSRHRNSRVVYKGR